MNVYTVIKEFDLTPLNVTLHVGDVVGKLAGSVTTTVNGAEYDNKAFYDWVGFGSQGFLVFSGVIPDPPTGAGVPRTPVGVPATPTSVGTQGTWATDGAYLYWCVAANTWVKWVVVTSW